MSNIILYHLYSAFLFLAFSITLCASIVLFIIHRKEQKKVTFYFTVIMISLTIIAFGMGLSHYCITFQMNKFKSVQLLYNTIQGIGNVLCIFFLPFFHHAILGQVITSLKKKIFLTIGSEAALAQILYLYIIHNLTLYQFMFRPALIGSIIYLLINSLIHFKDLKNRQFHNFVRQFLIITAIFCPLIIINIFFHFKKLPWALLNLSTSFFFCIFAFISIIFAVNYLGQPTFLDKNHNLTKCFIEKYLLTEREIEVIHLIITGKGNKEIAKLLFISPKTIENHLTSIYQKVNVHSRMQLINLIMTNEEIHVKWF